MLMDSNKMYRGIMDLQNISSSSERASGLLIKLVKQTEL